MLDFLPNAVALQLGPITIGWYGIAYAVGLALAYQVMVRLAARAGEDPEILVNGMIVVAVAALIGGRAYHVIDQWDNLYRNDPIRVILPPYAGLGVYGGIFTGTIAAFLYARYKGVPFLRWADIVAPGLFAMQAIGRWGNFFNQELYGPPTDLPWGIPIDCGHRIADYACPVGSDVTATLGQHFQPLFLYESLAGLLGLAVLVWIGYHWRSRLRPGDLLLFFFIWYGIVRFALENLRHDNWTVGGIPTAQLVSIAFIIPSLAILILRHGSRDPVDPPPTHPEVATWGALGQAVLLDDDDPELDADDDARFATDDLDGASDDLDDSAATGDTRDDVAGSAPGHADASGDTGAPAATDPDTASGG